MGRRGENDKEIVDGGDSSDSSDDESEVLSLRGNLFDKVNTTQSLGDTRTKGRRLSWASATTLVVTKELGEAVSADSHLLEQFHSLLTAPLFDDDDLLAAVQAFLSVIGDFLPKLRREAFYTPVVGKSANVMNSTPHKSIFPALHSLLKDPLCIRLYGLLTHFAYWNVLRPATRRILTRLDSKPPHPDRRIRSPPPKEIPPKFSLSSTIAKQRVEEERKRQEQSNKSIFAYDTLRNAPGVRVSMLERTTTYHDIENIFQNALNATGGPLPGEEDWEKDWNMATASQDSLPNGNTPNGLTRQFEDDVSLMDDSTLAESLDASEMDVSLSGHEKENLFIQLEACIYLLFKKLGKSHFGLITGRQSLVSCCHFIVDEILTAAFPWFATVDANLPNSSDSSTATPIAMNETMSPTLRKNLQRINLGLRRLVHQSLADLIDPSRVYTSAMLLHAVLGVHHSKRSNAATQQANRLVKNGTEAKSKFYRTSAAVSALLGDHCCPETRKLLQRGTPYYSPLPGTAIPFRSAYQTISEQQRDERTRQLTTAENKEISKPIQRSSQDNPIAYVRGMDYPAWEERQKHRIDFLHLFENQPTASYFPQSITQSPGKSRPSTSTKTISRATDLITEKPFMRGTVSKPLAKYNNKPRVALNKKAIHSVRGGDELLQHDLIFDPTDPTPVDTKLSAPAKAVLFNLVNSNVQTTSSVRPHYFI